MDELSVVSGGIDGGGLLLLFLIQKLLKFIIFGIITLFYQLLMYNIGVS